MLRVAGQLSFCPGIAEGTIAPGLRADSLRVSLLAVPAKQPLTPKMNKFIRSFNKDKAGPILHQSWNGYVTMALRCLEAGREGGREERKGPIPCAAGRA